jgi:UDP-N-acetylmuramyl pentapeptide phosphotransferase/UDP-N-acetylglucosamine-1-phosphate transferase
VMIAGGSFSIRSFGIDLWGLDAVAVWLGIPITIFAVVGLTNGFNMVDGIDGLASGHMLVGLGSVCLTLYLTRGQVHQLEWLLILMSAVFAFWLVNLSLTPLKPVFLGDAGSLLLGFVMAWTLIYYTQKPVALMHPVAALWCVTIPVFDTLVVIARRIKNKRSPFAPDRNHFHHLFVDMGMKPGVALASILGLAIVVNAFGVWMTYAISPVASLIAYGLFLMVFGFGMLHPSIERRLALKLRLSD